MARGEGFPVVGVALGRLLRGEVVIAVGIVQVREVVGLFIAIDEITRWLIVIRAVWARAGRLTDADASPRRGRPPRDPIVVGAAGVLAYPIALPVNLVQDSSVSLPQSVEAAGESRRSVASQAGEAAVGDDQYHEGRHQPRPVDDSILIAWHLLLPVRAWETGGVGDSRVAYAVFGLVSVGRALGGISL